MSIFETTYQKPVELANQHCPVEVSSKNSIRRLRIAMAESTLRDILDHEPLSESSLQAIVLITDSHPSLQKKYEDAIRQYKDNTV